MAVVVAGAVITGCSTPSSLDPLSVSLEYERMAEAPMFPTLPDCARLSSVEVDAGGVGDSIGTRWIEEKEDVTADVTVSSDLAGWVREGALQALDRAGVETDVSGAPALRLTLEKIVTRENVLRRAGYDSEIEIDVSLSSDGTSCWTGRIEGQDGNYGYAGNPVAYHEMLNEALDLALIDLLGDTGFQDVICSCGS